ncbi:MAG: tetraacyldisaccharide 4'-kinase [Aestuariibacter sp.]
MALFALLSWLRRLAYRNGIYASHKMSVPVIVVGNISVGGNGKTPLVVYLCDLLRQQGYYPGVLSRGYGGKSRQYPLAVGAHTHSDEVGDEPLLIKKRVNCPVVVDPKRPRGAQSLIEDHHCNIIICDDGLQHYALQRDIEIIVMDGQRRLGNGQLLPVGPLREGPWRLKQADFVVINGGETQNGEYRMSLESGRLVNVKFPTQSRSISDINTAVTIAAGIGHPERFFSVLRGKGVKIKQTLSFPDHYQYKTGDLPEDTVLMTEKDAVKCQAFASDNWWFLPVSANLTAQFKTKLLEKLKQIKK